MVLDVEKLPLEGAGGLFEVLQTITGPRKPRGVRRKSVALLAMGVTATLAGAKSPAAMAQWAVRMRTMASTRTLPVWCLLATATLAQPLFDIQAPGAFPVLPGVDAECVGALASASSSPAPVIRFTPLCGFPAGGGLQYAYLNAGGDPGGGLVVPAGGPIPLPAATGFAHGIRIPIPPGATAVSFFWEFFDAEQVGFYNDALEVSVVSVLGVRIGAPLVYADVALAIANPGTCLDPNGGRRELGAPAGVTGGPQIFSGPLASGGAYLQVLCANSFDDVVSSSAIIDNLVFDAPYVCAPAAFLFDQPAGPGSLRVEVQNGEPNSVFLVPVKLGSPGLFPNGWCFGVDLTLGELLEEIAFGPPFTGTLDGGGNFVFFVPSGVPAGLQIFAGCGTFGPGGQNGLFPPAALFTR